MRTELCINESKVDSPHTYRLTANPIATSTANVVRNCQLTLLPSRDRNGAKTIG